MTNDNIITDYDLIVALDKCGLKDIPGPCLWAGKWIQNIYYPSGAIQHMTGEWESCCNQRFHNPFIEWYKQPNIYELLKYLVYKKKIIIQLGPDQMIIHANSSYADLNAYYNKSVKSQSFESFLELSFSDYFTKYLQKYQNTY